jgi:hypothetical protein
MAKGEQHTDTAEPTPTPPEPGRPDLRQITQENSVVLTIVRGAVAMVIITIIAAGVLSALGKDVPPQMEMIGTGSMGLLTGLLAVSSKFRDRS